MPEFKISVVGDVNKRVILGPTVGIELFRILRFSMENLILAQLGMGKEEENQAKANENIYLVGKAVGGEIGKAFLSGIDDLNEYVTKLKEILINLKVGILKVVSADLEKGKIVVDIEECVTCVGTPNIGAHICYFEGGLVAGILKFFLKKEVAVVEVKCCANGDNVCEFEATIKE